MYWQWRNTDICQDMDSLNERISRQKRNVTITMNVGCVIRRWKGIFVEWPEQLVSQKKCWKPDSDGICHKLGQEIMQQVWWLLFCHRRANAVEQSAWTVSATGYHLRTIQTIIENVCLVSWATAPCVWTLRALTRNCLTYLLTYFKSKVKKGIAVCRQAFHHRYGNSHAIWDHRVLPATW